MNSNQENSRGHLQHGIDAEIKALEESTGIRALRLRRNALSPISTLPLEVFTAIFSLLCPSSPDRNPDHHLARLRVSHVCHQWRQIALNQPLLWSNVNFATVSLAGAIEILDRAKSVPLYLDARISHSWDEDRFNTFRTEFRARVPYICDLRITAEHFHLHRTLEGLVSPAPTLESLVVVSHGGFYNGELGFILPDTLFNGSTPRLSCLKLFLCEINWTSPLLKGLRHLEIQLTSSRAKPTLEAWLDALDELPHLKLLALSSASPIATSFPFDVNRTATLPSLTHFEILASPGDCALALAHLDLPALTELHVIARLPSHHPDNDDVPRLLPYVVRHAHGPQDTHPLQSMLIRSNGYRADILAWSVPNIDVEAQDPHTTFLTKTPPTRVALSFTYSDGSFIGASIELLDEAIAALPLDGLVTLVAQDFAIPQAFWFHHVPRWSLLRHVQLAAPSDDGFKQMLMIDNGGQENPLLPSLEELVLIGTLSIDWALTLTKRVSQQGPLELLDLRMCVPHSHEHHMVFSVLAFKVLAPEIPTEARKQMISVWATVARGILIEEADWDSESGYTYTTDDSDNEHRENGLDLGFDEDEGDVDDEQDGEEEEVEDE